MSLLDDIDLNSDTSIDFDNHINFNNHINFDEIDKYYNYNLGDKTLKNYYKIYGSCLFLFFAVYYFHIIKITTDYTNYKNRKLICYY